MKRTSVGCVPVWKSGVLLLLLAACTSDNGTGSGVPQDIRFATLGAGTQATCGVSREGVLYCWGAGVAARNGEPALAPHRAADGRYAAVSVGAAHACVVATTGAAWCWGANREYQLGDGRNTDRSTLKEVVGAPHETGVFAGGQHSCALDTDGTLRCWGWGATGQLGVGTTDDLGYSEAVPGYTFESASTGSEHTCGLSADGTAWCWGRDDDGQVGSPATDRCLRDGVKIGCALRPLAVGDSIRFVAISAGDHHTCAIDTEARAWCWGAGTAGQLGTGSLTDSPVPTLVATDVRFQAIAAGSRHTCGLDLDGRAWCWGRNDFGRLGRVQPAGVVPMPVAVETDTRFTAIVAGTLHTCAIAEDGTAWCWGFGGYGQLGTGEAISQAIPQPVAPAS